MNRLNDISTYILLRMIVCDGKEEYPDIVDSIPLSKVKREIEQRYKVNFHDDKNLWVNWFCKECSEATDKQRNSLEMTLKIKLSEKNFFDSSER